MYPSPERNKLYWLNCKTNVIFLIVTKSFSSVLINLPKVKKTRSKTFATNSTGISYEQKAYFVPCGILHLSSTSLEGYFAIFVIRFKFCFCFLLFPSSIFSENLERAAYENLKTMPSPD